MNDIVGRDRPPSEPGLGMAGASSGGDVDGALDHAALDRLWDILGEDLEGIANAFRELLPSQTDELERALVEGDLKRIANCAHSMKGSSANLGAVRLSAAAARAEQAAKACDLGAARQALAQVRAEAQPALQALARFMSGRAARGDGGGRWQQ